jgi:formamidopyrimidine-DNA glycosylase
VEVLNPKVIKEPGVSEFRKRLKGKVFKDFLRRGKVLAGKLSGGNYLVVHLRMTGQLVYSAEKGNKARVIFVLSGGKYLNFNDQRLFAELRAVDDWQKLKFVRGLGIEPLEKEFTAQKFKAMLAGKKTKIKPLLMDQSFIAGIGNLYAQEAAAQMGLLKRKPKNCIAQFKRFYGMPLNTAARPWIIMSTAGEKKANIICGLRFMAEGISPV